MPCSCGNEGETRLLYACSGMANTGLLADQVWRALARDKAGTGTCLAAIGAGIPGYVLSARNAARNIVLDGCPVACGAKILGNAGIAFEHHVMTDYGAEKGKTPVTGGLVEDIAARIAARIDGSVDA